MNTNLLEKGFPIKKKRKRGIKEVQKTGERKIGKKGVEKENIAKNNYRFIE